MYVGINDKARKIVAAYVGDANGKARKIVKGYVGDANNKARLFYDSTTPGGGGGNSDDYPVLTRDWFYGAYNQKLPYTTIEIVDSYTPTGSEEGWRVVDESKLGRIKYYQLGDKLIIAGDGSGGIKAPVDSNGLFDSFANVTSINGLNLLDTSNVTNMSQMFRSSGLTSIDLSNFDTSNVTNMSHMFNSCDLTSIDLSNFDTSNVTNMYCMFGYCYELTSLDLTSFDTSNVTDMSSMFWCCYDLTSVLVTSGKWTTANASTEGMFYDCGTSSVTYV